MLQRQNDDGRLIAGEPEAISIQSTFVAGVGWTCAIHIRRQFQSWDQAAHGHYEMLSTPELVTLIDAAVCAELKL